MTARCCQFAESLKGLILLRQLFLENSNLTRPNGVHFSPRIQRASPLITQTSTRRRMKGGNWGKRAATISRLVPSWHAFVGNHHLGLNKCPPPTSSKAPVGRSAFNGNPDKLTAKILGEESRSKEIAICMDSDEH